MQNRGAHGNFLFHSVRKAFDQLVASIPQIKHAQHFLSLADDTFLGNIVESAHEFKIL
jgi:hypothetical protein